MEGKKKKCTVGSNLKRLSGSLKGLRYLGTRTRRVFDQLEQLPGLRTRFRGKEGRGVVWRIHALGEH